MINQIVELLLTIPAVLIALTVHEYAHGYAAWRLGDPTARSLGRLSLNPLKHLDLFGAISLLLFHFGWAKPVPINTRYFKKPRRDMAITALCGPLANFLLAFFAAFLYVALLAVFEAILTAEISRFLFLLLQYTLKFVYIFHILNLSLGFFNCLPVPPLDGSRFFLSFLPARLYFKVMQYERYISLALLILLFIGVLTGPLSAAVNLMSTGMLSLFMTIFGMT